LIALGMFGLAASAIAADPPPAPAKHEKKVCRREDVVGSIIPDHVCRTKAEWDQIDAQNAEANKGFLERRGEAHGTLNGPH
jgi:hypothetical protein